MKETVNRCDFHDRFRDTDRLSNFTYEARNMIFDYIEEYEESTGEEIELDVIAICCDYTEEHWQDVQSYYPDDFEGVDFTMEATIDRLNELTIVVGSTDDHIVYLNY